MSYLAVVLSEQSSEKLKKVFGNIQPDWEWYGHHMTIKLGGATTELQRYVGTQYTLLVTHIGQSDLAVAVKVADSGLSLNKIPHVTLRVNTKQNGKPVDSNKIVHWNKVESVFSINGIVEELV